MAHIFFQFHPPANSAHQQTPRKPRGPVPLGRSLLVVPPQASPPFPPSPLPACLLALFFGKTQRAGLHGRLSLSEEEEEEEGAVRNPLPRFASYGPESAARGLRDPLPPLGEGVPGILPPPSHPSLPTSLMMAARGRLPGAMVTAPPPPRSLGGGGSARHHLRSWIQAGAQALTERWRRWPPLVAGGCTEVDSDGFNPSPLWILSGCPVKRTPPRLTRGVCYWAFPPPPSPPTLRIVHRSLVSNPQL